MTNPLAGVLKIEVLPHGNEIENGLDKDRVDSLSADHVGTKRHALRIGYSLG